LPAASVRWVQPLIPWRWALVTSLAGFLRRRVRAYLATRSRFSPQAPGGDPPPEALLFSGDVITPLEAGELASIPIVPGEVAGKLRRVVEPGDLERVQDGDVVWCPESPPWLSRALPRAAAVLTRRGGGLTHVALNCAARGVPCAAGVDAGELDDGQEVRVRIDARGAEVEA
jgi:phosphohistidine swiveling domain-containing protein